MQIIEELVNYQSRYISKGHSAKPVSTISVVITSFSFFLAIISHLYLLTFLFCQTRSPTPNMSHSFQLRCFQRSRSILVCILEIEPEFFITVG